MSKFSINEIIDMVYYGTDLEFKYNNWYYFINSGWIADDFKKEHTITAYKSDSSFYEDEAIPEKVEILYVKTTQNGNENVNNFFDAKIFDNKNFSVDSMYNAKVQKFQS